MGGVDLQGTITEFARKCESLLARCNSAVGISRYSQYLGHLG
jgi:hypothetical protein